MTRKIALIVAAVLSLAAIGAGIAVAAGGGNDSQPPAQTASAAPPEQNENEQSENEQSENEPYENEQNENESGEEAEGRDSDENLTGPTANNVAQAALQATGGGTVLEIERGDSPNAAHEAEIRTADGSVVEVLLDANLNVIGQVAGDD